MSERNNDSPSPSSHVMGSEEKIERLTKVLEFYANPEIYKPHPHGPAFERRDLSYHAREVLTEVGQ